VLFDNSPRNLRGKLVSEKKLKTRRCGFVYVKLYASSRCGQTATQTGRVVAYVSPLARSTFNTRLKALLFPREDQIGTLFVTRRHSITFDMSSSNVEHVNLAFFDSE